LIHIIDEVIKLNGCVKGGRPHSLALRAAFTAVQEAKAAARFQRGKPPRNLCHLSFAHVRLTFGRRVSPSAFRLALHPASRGSLASHRQPKVRTDRI
jgi:hypothetical protein